MWWLTYTRTIVIVVVVSIVWVVELVVVDRLELTWEGKCSFKEWVSGTKEITMNIECDGEVYETDRTNIVMLHLTNKPLNCRRYVGTVFASDTRIRCDDPEPENP